MSFLFHVKRQIMNVVIYYLLGLSPFFDFHDTEMK